MEEEQNGYISFLDVRIMKVAGGVTFTVHREPIHTDAYLNRASCHPRIMFKGWSLAWEPEHGGFALLPILAASCSMFMTLSLRMATANRKQLAFLGVGMPSPQPTSCSSVPFLRLTCPPCLRSLGGFSTRWDRSRPSPTDHFSACW